MMNLQLKSSLLLIYIVINASATFSQLATVNLSVTQDSYVTSQLPSQNFGSDSYLKAGTVKPRFLGPYYQRTFVEFDLSSIPPNAVVYSANIKMKIYNGPNGSNPFRTKLVTSSWLEESITAADQPDISNDAADVSSTYSINSGIISIDVTSMAQRMVYNQVSNYGWSVQVLDETYSGLTGATFYSNESHVYSPTLEVKYYLPLTISNVSVTHESASGAGDGAISLTVNNGSGLYSYNWIDGSTGSTISTSSSVSDLSYGWYGLHVIGAYDEEFYYAFLVGTECKEVTINMETSPEYTDNAFLFSLVKSGIDYGDINYANYPYTRSFRWTDSGIWNSGKSLLKFRIWMDPAFQINQADMTMYGSAHSTLGGSNTSELDLITEDWDESLVTWNNAPDSSSSTNVVIPATTSSTQNNTVNLIDFWNNWKTDNSQNYGLILQLQNFNNYYHEQRYHSSASTTTSYRPDLVFKLDLTHPEEPYYCYPIYAELERKLTGVNYKTYYDKLFFAYDNEYTSTSSTLTYQIFEEGDRVSPVVDGSTISLNLDYGKNQFDLDLSTASLSTGGHYVLVVTNDKNEKFYLRFEYQ